MYRHRVRPYGHPIATTRVLSLVMALALIWMLYGWVRDPATWRWLDRVDERPVMANGHAQPGTPTAVKVEGPESVVPGPNELDTNALREFQSKQELVSDRAPLRPREMNLYWTLMQWSRTEPFKKLERRADATSTFSQLWEKPSQHRGKLMRLRLHIRRVLHYPAPDNPLGLKDVYEAWGWTDESKSFPYVVVFPERPPGLPLGGEVQGEIVFVGYFFKIMSYEAFDVHRGAPLLVGRARAVATSNVVTPRNESLSIWVWLLVTAGIAAFAGLAIHHWRKFRPARMHSQLPAELSGFDASPIPNLSVSRSDDSSGIG